MPAVTSSSVCALFLLTLVCSTIASSKCSCKDRLWDCARLNFRIFPSNERCENALIVKLEDNSLEDLPDGISSAETIIASSNQIPRLPSISKLNPRLKILELNNNRIQSFSTEYNALSELQLLWIQNNRLTDLKFLPTACNIYSLDASNNSITNLSGPLENCSRLLFLSLSHNRVTSIPNNLFSKMTNLLYLYLHNNYITSIPDGIFSGQVEVINLSLHSNIGINLFSGSFQGLAKLQDLDLSSNDLSTLPSRIFSSTPQLVMLDLQENRLQDLPPNIFESLNSIRVINLMNNQLAQVPVLRNCCSKLQKIVLEENQIRNPSEEALRSSLRGNIHTNLGRNPIQVESLRWALTAQDVQLYVDTPCNCGGLSSGNATMEFCVAMQCGSGLELDDWRAAVETSSI